MIIKRVLCLIGFHTWANWHPAFTGGRHAPVYQFRQCLACGRAETDLPKKYKKKRKGGSKTWMPTPKN